MISHQKIWHLIYLKHLTLLVTIFFWIKMENLGIRWIVRAWFKMYLSNRRQYMELYVIISDTKILTCGVLQGSIPEPMFSLIYVNDMIFTNGSLLSLSMIQVNSYDIETLYDGVNIGKLSEWFKANNLCLNVKKTKYILFRPNALTARTTRYLKFLLMAKKVDQIRQIQTNHFLELHIDEILSWR